MAWGDADRDVFLETAVFGVAVVFGATSTIGTMDTWTEEFLAGQVVAQEGTMNAVRVKTGAFPPVLGAAITVGGVNYTIRDFRLEEPDGRFTLIKLAG